MRDGKALARDLANAGFRLIRRTNHAVWGCPCGHALLVTATTGDGKGSADINVRTRMARTLRACQQQRSTAA